MRRDTCRPVRFELYFTSLLAQRNVNGMRVRLIKDLIIFGRRVC